MSIGIFASTGITRGGRFIYELIDQLQVRVNEANWIIEFVRDPATS